MAVFEKVIKQEDDAQREFERQMGRPEKKSDGPSLSEILNNKDKSDLFGEYLETEGQTALGRKLTSKQELTREDMDGLAEQRNRFLEIQERSENIAAALDPATIEELFASSPELRSRKDLFGGEAIRATLIRHLPRLAITDRERFISLEQNIGVMKKNKEATTAEEEEIKKIYKEYGISEKEYIELIRGGDATEVAKEVYSQLSFFKKRVTEIKDIQRKIESLAGSKASVIEAYRKQHANDMKKIGGLLEMTIVDNPVLNKILVAGLRKEKIEVPEANMSFSELKNTTEPDADTVQAEWDKYQLEHAADHKTNNMSYEDAVHKFSGEYGKKMGTRKKGFWSKFWGGLFSRNVEKILKK